MERSRQSGNVRENRQHWEILVNGAYYGGGDKDERDYTKYSAMSDVISGSLRPNNPCLHQKVLVATLKYPSHTGTWLSGPTSTVTINAPDCEIQVPLGVIPGIPDVSKDFSAFLGDAADHFTQQFRSKVSLANFLYELKDFKDVVKKIRRLATGGGILKSIQSGWDGIKEQASQGVGGNFLEYQFNWRPLVEDTKKLLEFANQAMNRLEFLVGHSQYYDHFRRRFLIPPNERDFTLVSVWNISEFLPPYGWQYYVDLVPSQCQVEFNASALVENKLQLEAINSWWACADQLGLNNLPKIVWNATKLSWLVDFFVDSSEFFESFEVQAYKGTLGVLGGSASKKITRFYDVRVTRSGSEPSTATVEGAVRVVNYDRAPMVPIQGGLFSLHDSLTTDQRLILASLVDSQAGASSRAIQSFARTFNYNRRTFGRRSWKRK